MPAWSENRYIFSRLQKHVAGDTAKFWLNYLFEDLIGEKFNRVLSVGCGDGDHEIILSKSGLFKTIDACDSTEASITRAREKASGEGCQNIHFFVSNHDMLMRDEKKYTTYDCVCFFGSLHQVRDIEEMLRYVFNLLTHNGLLVFQEYTGPIFTLLDEAQLEVTNRVLRCFSNELRSGDGGDYVNPPITAIYRDNPVKAPRSSIILQLVEIYFERIHLLPLPGVILQKLYSQLNHALLNDGSAASNTILDLLFTIEDLLIEDGRLKPTRYLGIYRPRKSLAPLPVFGG